MTNTVYIAMSLDGFIAENDGGVAFLESAGPAPEGEDYGWAEFFDPIDALIMGRNTYDVVLGFKQWHYEGKKVMVLTTRDIPIPEFITSEIIPFEGTPRQAVKELNDRGCENLYIDGGKVVQQFLNAGLVDNIVITVVPVLIGGGIPLFGALKNHVKLKAKDTRHFDNGLIQLHYDVIG